MSPTNPLFLNTIILGGTTNAKLDAARRAGFDQIELWKKDVDAAPGGLSEVADQLRRLDLGLTDFQVLLDFDGASDATRDVKRAEALTLLDMAEGLSASTVIVPANTRADVVRGRIAEDLRWICAAAAPRGIRIAYEAMAWSSAIDTIPAAWAMIQEVDKPNLGLVVDAFHIFAKGRTVADLDGIPASAMLLVQLSDLSRDDLAGLSANTLIETARHRRLLPGAGAFPLRTLLASAALRSYGGPIGIEVFNDALQAADPDDTARRAMDALQAVLAG